MESSNLNWTDVQKAAIVAVFDGALAGVTSALEQLIDEGGVHPIFHLANLLEYPRKDEVYRVAIEYSVRKHTEKVENTDVQYACGCRHPDSEFGTSDKAFVVAKSEDFITAAVFMDGKDYIGHPQSDEEAKEQYDAHVADGWVPMTNEDVVKTSGIHADKVKMWEIPSVV